MNEDFFSYTAPNLNQLNSSDRSIYDYITQNLNSVKNCSIRALAHECYVSTSTIFRFVQKLGFSGYADFINLVRLTSAKSTPHVEMAFSSFSRWQTDYIRLMAEMMLLVTEEKLEAFAQLLKNATHIVILGNDACADAAQYAKRALAAQGYLASVSPRRGEFEQISPHLCEQDLLIFLSDKGSSVEDLAMLQRILAQKHIKLACVANSFDNPLSKVSTIYFPLVFSTGEGDRSIMPFVLLFDCISNYYGQKTALIRSQEESQS